MRVEEEVCVERKQKIRVDNKEEVCVERDQKIRVDNSTKEEVRVKRDQKMMSYFGKIDNNMTRFFRK